MKAGLEPGLLEEPARSQGCRRAVGQEALRAWQGGGLLYQKHPRLLGEATATPQELQIMTHRSLPAEEEAFSHRLVEK